MGVALGKGRPGFETHLLVWVCEKPLPGYDPCFFICHTCRADVGKRRLWKASYALSSLFNLMKTHRRAALWFLR